MNVLDHLWPANDEVIVAAPQLFAVNIGGGEVELVDVGTHRPDVRDGAIGHYVQAAAVGEGACHAKLLKNAESAKGRKEYSASFSHFIVQASSPRALSFPR